jgi:hypothetical protein
MPLNWRHRTLCSILWPVSKNIPIRLLMPPRQIWHRASAPDTQEINFQSREKGR